MRHRTNDKIPLFSIFVQVFRRAWQGQRHNSIATRGQKLVCPEVKTLTPNVTSYFYESVTVSYLHVQYGTLKTAVFKVLFQNLVLDWSVGLKKITGPRGEKKVIAQESRAHGLYG